ncbi:MAG: ABC transporter ATP-binding protein [Mycoplasma sp.]
MFKKNSLFKIFQNTTNKNKKSLIYSFIFVFLSVICDLMITFLFSDLIKNISLLNGDSTNTAPTFIVISLMFLCAFVGFFFHFWSIKISTKNAIRIGAEIRFLSFKKTLEVSQIDLNHISQNSLINRITNDASDIIWFFKAIVCNVARGSFYIIFSIPLFIIQLATFKGNNLIWLSLISFIFIFIFIFVMYKKFKFQKPYFINIKTDTDNNFLLTKEALSGYKTIKTLNLNDSQNKKFKTNNKKMSKNLTFVEKNKASLTTYNDFFFNFATILVLLLISLISWFSFKEDFVNNDKLIALAFSLTQYFTFIIFGFTLMIRAVDIFLLATICANRVIELWEIKNTTISNSPWKPSNFKISFKDVSFGYSETSLLKNINMTIEEGSTIGIVGPSGSGKTTLLNMMVRLFDPTTGVVSIGDKDIKTLDLNFIRENIGFCIQDKSLISGTILENIIFDKNKYDLKDIEQVLDFACANDFISKLPNGLNYLLEENGSNLSGGQRQRIAIARSLIKNPKIFIFDDTTSALDNKTEKKILKNIDEHFDKVTKIFVAQKLKTIENCDNIFVIDGGEIVQQGKHQELIKNKDGLYYKIWLTQNTTIGG